MKCVVCGNSKKGDFIGPQATFHIFPLNEDSKRKWLIAIGKEPNTILRRTIDCVCSYHFTDDSYSLTAKKKRTLLPTAIPSIISFPETSSQSPTTSYSSITLAESHSYRLEIQFVSEKSQTQMFTQPVEIYVSEEASTAKGASKAMGSSTASIRPHPTKNKCFLVTPHLLGIFKNRSTQTDCMKFSDKAVQCQLMPARTSSSIKKAANLVYYDDELESEDYTSKS